jgi:hypothetical protein
VGGADDREQADTGRWMTMSNYSDVWLKDNLDETKLAILEAEYALEMLPYTVQNRPLYAFIGWIFVRPIVFILKRGVERVEKRIEREYAAAARFSLFQSRKGDTCHKSVDRRRFIGGRVLAWQGRGEFNRLWPLVRTVRLVSDHPRDGVALRATVFATSHGASARASRRGQHASAPPRLRRVVRRWRREGRRGSPRGR